VCPRSGLAGAENLASTEIRSLDRPARSEYLYRPYHVSMLRCLIQYEAMKFSAATVVVAVCDLRKLGIRLAVETQMYCILLNNQLDAQFFFSYIFIPILYMFRAPMCSSSGESLVLIRHLVYVTVCR
jgi:hypothetical protein